MTVEAEIKELLEAVDALNLLVGEIHARPSASSLPSLIRGITFLLLSFTATYYPGAGVSMQRNESIRRDALKQLHRSMLSGAHIYFEEDLSAWCKGHGIVVTSNREKWLDDYRERVKDRITRKELKELERFADLRPNSRDLLDAVFAAVPNLHDRVAWRKFFDHFAIVRNNASHAGNRLTDGQIESLKEGAFSTWIDGRHLRISVQHYAQICRAIRDFFIALEIRLPAV